MTAAAGRALSSLADIVWPSPLLRDLDPTIVEAAVLDDPWSEWDGCLKNRLEAQTETLARISQAALDPACGVRFPRP